jgi:anti-anti-sigma factor
MNVIREVVHEVDRKQRILKLRGQFDGFAARPFLAQVDALVAGGCRELVIDLADVRFLSCSAVRALLRANRTLARCHDVLRLGGLSGVARWTLATLGVGYLLLDERQAA